MLAPAVWTVDGEHHRVTLQEPVKEHGAQDWSATIEAVVFGASAGVFGASAERPALALEGAELLARRRRNRRLELSAAAGSAVAPGSAAAASAAGSAASGSSAAAGSAVRARDRAAASICSSGG